MIMADKRFLGTGCKFPVQIDPATGRFMTVSGNRSVKESIYLILMTQRTERLVRPDFGSDIMSFTFMDTGTTMLSILKRNLSQTIMREEPRISDLEITLEHRDRQGVIIINLDYMVAETNTRENMVFPFYLDRGSTEAEESIETDIPTEVGAISYYDTEDDY